MFCVDLQLTLCRTETYRAHLLVVIREMALAACLSLSTGREEKKKHCQVKQSPPENLHGKYFSKKKTFNHRNYV